MSGASFDPWLALAVALFITFFLVMAVIARRERKPVPSTDAKLDALDRRLSDAEKALAAVDHDLRSIRLIVGNLPTKESINAIAVQVAESRGKMEGMQGQLHGLAKSCDRIEDWLMKASAEAIAGVKSDRAGAGPARERVSDGEAA